MIFGDQQNVKACTLMPNEGPDDVRTKMQAAINSFDDPDHVLFLIDLWSGTPFNQANILLGENEDKDWAIVTGMNLPMVIEAYTARMTMQDASAKEIATHIVGVAKDGVKTMPEDLMPAGAADTAQPEQHGQPTGAIPEGTVLGDGHIKYSLIRIDSRLLHGQVATSWTKTVKPDRIIVVSDAVSQDSLRKNMIVQAAPPGVPANVIPIKKMVEVSQDPRFGATHALVLFETPEDLLTAVKAGLDIKEVNVGSMAHKVGKVAVTKAVSLDQTDIDTYKELLKLGVQFNVRMLPSSSTEDINDLLERAAKGLAEGKQKA